MAVPKAKFKALLEQGDLAGLFNELGWDRSKTPHLDVLVDNAVVRFDLVADKRGFLVGIHRSKKSNDKQARQRIEKRVARVAEEHLLVFVDENTGTQVWQLAIRRPGQPVTYHEATWYKGQGTEHLFQKLSGLFIAFSEEEHVTLVDVKQRVTAQFERNTKDVTKKFYREFSQQHKEFLKFIKGIKEKVDQEWYASLMLNRLMFIYFIQKKGFLDGDPDYLQNKLKESTERKGKDKFYSFYRNFLLVLFHQGLGSPTRSAQLLKEIGKVPYLNGGLFDVHDLEKPDDTHVADKAFEGLFKFFDKWNWHLDTRQTGDVNTVNPDVIGYIFEQYINDRAQMGAYYTKEDITEYISKNTIIPWLFDEAKRKDAQAFKPEGGVWKLLRDDPDKYIYPSVRHGIVVAEDHAHHTGPWWQDPIFNDLPAEVRAGLDPEQKDLWKIRKAWNVRAPEAIALPTEIYRELIDRRRRYLEVRRKLVAGEVTSINDLITYNLDIRQFAQDVIHEYEGSDLVGAFYDAISRITVLDPTCGSGAFLFAALGILQPLYEECLDRMQWFVEVDNEKGTGKKHPEFRKVLDRMKQHPNRDYFIYKSIILQNLYGVDIMREAVEIAKLRLFLKLVSTVDPDPKEENYGIEPLPDIDFNIRSGNTLVGFSTKAEVKKISDWTFGFDAKEQDRVEEKCEVVDKAFERYKEIQLNEGEDYQTFRKAKDELHKRLAALREELDVYLAKSYTITDLPKQQKQFAAWKQSHAPFHWFAEYYGIVHQRGGFDVIIGNPPYVEVKKQELLAWKLPLEAIETGNLYGAVLARVASLRAAGGCSGMIVPLSFISTKQYEKVRRLLEKSSRSHYTAYDIRPDHLFDGAAVRLTIALWAPDQTQSIFTGRQRRWYTEERPALFESIGYGKNVSDAIVFRDAAPAGFSANKKLSKPRYNFQGTGAGVLWVATTANNFIKCYHEQPRYTTNGEKTKPSGWRTINVQTAETAAVASVINSSSFYFVWKNLSDGFNMTNGFTTQALSGLCSTEVLKPLDGRWKAIANAMDENSEEHVRNQKTTGRTVIQLFRIKPVKPLLDEVDALLAKHYGLTEDELDHVINYDIKYRMGDELEGEEKRSCITPTPHSHESENDTLFSHGAVAPVNAQSTGPEPSVLSV